MCDYCDCRSHPQIAALSAEHEILLGLLGELRGAIDRIDPDRMRDLLVGLRVLVDAHAMREERGVFTELRRAALDDRDVTSFEDEHQQIHALIESATVGDGRFEAARDLVHVLGAHIEREETDLFPAAHQLLTPAQWDAVDDATAELVS